MKNFKNYDYTYKIELYIWIRILLDSIEIFKNKIVRMN